jgi:signal peptidase I
MARSLKQETKNPNQSPQENPWIEGIKTIVTAAILAFGIRAFVAEARYIPSSSMEPTLQVNDRLIIEKVSYHFQEPKRGDVVVFNPTKALQEKDFRDAFIKRVIGLPGESIEVKTGKVYVNGQAIKEKYISEDPNYNYGPITVPKRQYLVLGDNRNNSYDSHYWGHVPKEKIIGKAFVRFWPFNRLEILHKHPIYPSTQP